MRIMFIHQNMPGQFRHLIPRMATDGHEVVCVGRRPDYAPPGIGRVSYALPDSRLAEPNPFLGPLENAVRHGVQVARAGEALAQQGFRPDLIVAHPGWGESLYIKQVFPTAKLLHYCEFFYRTEGADVNFNPAERQDLMTDCATLTRNAPLLLALAAGDWGMSPTVWQRQVHPEIFHPRISVRFDGIDTTEVQPNPAAGFRCPDGSVLRAGDPVVTYVARSLEPQRGFPAFIRALPAILRALPAAKVLIAGGEQTSYGKPPVQGGTWRAAMATEVPTDPSRVHFLGAIPRPDYLRLLQVSAAHVYLTVPFVLSWSMIEAMAAGCLVVGSATPPVAEVIEDGRNGLLVDLFDPSAIAGGVIEALRAGPAVAQLRQAARWTALQRYALDRCLPRQLALLDDVAAGRTPLD